jgi:hypothetical protein
MKFIGSAKVKYVVTVNFSVDRDFYISLKPKEMLEFEYKIKEKLFNELKLFVDYKYIRYLSNPIGSEYTHIERMYLEVGKKMIFVSHELKFIFYMLSQKKSSQNIFEYGLSSSVRRYFLRRDRVLEKWKKRYEHH